MFVVMFGLKLVDAVMYENKFYYKTIVLFFCLWIFYAIELGRLCRF